MMFTEQFPKVLPSTWTPSLQPTLHARQSEVFSLAGTLKTFPVMLTALPSGSRSGAVNRCSLAYS